MNNERAPRHALGFRAQLQTLGIALGALMMAGAGFFAVGPSEKAVSAECPAQFRIDFSNLPAGTIISEQYADLGVHISAEANGNHPDSLIVFDTNAPPTHDPDLAVDIGNIAILAENVRDENGDGLVDDPDENNFGGRVTFTFDQDVTIPSFVFVDHDNQPADFAAAYDASGNLIKQVAIPIADDGSVQTIDVNAEGVRRFELVYRDSGGFGGIEVECEQPGGGATPTATPAGGGGPTPTPEGGGQATPTATPAGAGAGTPTPGAGGQATPTPVTGGQQVTSSPAAQQPVAVAAAVQPPQAAQAAAGQQPAAVPAGGGRPTASGEIMSWFALALVAGGLALAGGGGLALVRERIRER